LVFGTACASSPPRVATGTAARPTLVVLVVVDQLRADLLDRYADLFTGGFKRLADNGHSYSNAAHDHASTATAPGHATLGTGVHPSRHGIIANIWLEASGGAWKVVSNVGDSTASIVGAPTRPGVSPHYVMRSGFAEWLKSASPQSEIASVSGKDRGAIQSIAHAPGYAYWFDAPSGRFVTSTYYRTSDPSWVRSYNTGRMQRHLADSVWTLTVPEAKLGRANRDTISTERDGVNTYFPHRFSVEGAAGFWPWWEATPNLDLATLEFAETMVTALNLGRDESPDFLNVSLSATDLIGHIFGPLSREQLDNLLRLDRELGQFFDFLDSKVGKGRWTMMLSADHGVLDSPEDLVARGEYGHRLTAAEIAQLDSLRASALKMSNKREAAEMIVRELKKNPLVADAWLQSDLERGQLPDSFAVLQRRAMYEGRYGGRFAREGVEFRFIPGVLSLPRGSSHGQTYWYDRHVPMIFMGPGIPAGRDPSRAATVDFAPTLSAILGIPYPKDLDGKVLSGVLSR
ncbi:MAG: alkaline phosphatase family protein, partial [Longimicrobiales bacterium]